MAAAVADFRPAKAAAFKIKKTDDDSAPSIELVRNPDILAEVAAHRSRAGQVVVGFAAETGDSSTDVLSFARAKLARKGCDLLVVNEVGVDKTFGADHNTVTVLDRDGGEHHVEHGTKAAVAASVWDMVLARLTPRAG
jgi:phosphopantothenoylcysteine decarboxylase/phosphopantothenate--cysteine ligase